MAEILEIYAIARRLFAPDSLPMAQLSAPSGIQLLKERYKFANLAPLSGVNVVAQGGEFRSNDGSTPIQSLVLEPNVIQYQVAGGTAEGEAFYEDLLKFLGKTWRMTTKDYARTFQTIAVAKLNVPVRSLFSREMVKFIEKTALPKFAVEGGTPSVVLGSLSWVINYLSESADLAYQPRPFTIEPRAGSRPEDNLYYTASPTESKTHLKLLNDFEQQLSAQPKPGRISRH